jgi:hypothetical protein
MLVDFVTHILKAQYNYFESLLTLTKALTRMCGGTLTLFYGAMDAHGFIPMQLTWIHRFFDTHTESSLPRLYNTSFVHNQFT